MNQTYLRENPHKLKEIEDRIKEMHYEDNSCLRVIAEKIVNWRYIELSNEFEALRWVIKILKEEGVEWTKSQIRRALKYCYDPRYYRRIDMKEVYELADIDIDYLPSVPKNWRGITEWVYTNDEKSENWHASKVRVGSKDLTEEEYQYHRNTNY